MGLCPFNSIWQAEAIAAKTWFFSHAKSTKVVFFKTNISPSVFNQFKIRLEDLFLSSKGTFLQEELKKGFFLKELKISAKVAVTK
jgi:hypothetical protein